MAVRVKEVGEKDNVGVRVVLVSNEAVGISLVRNATGKIIDVPHSRFREDGKQVRNRDDLDIPWGDYRQMLFMAGGILGKKRRKAPVS